MCSSTAIAVWLLSLSFCTIVTSLTLAGESGVSEEAMANTAKMLEEKKISKEDNGSVIVDFEGLVPGKEGKRLGKTVIRYVILRSSIFCSSHLDKLGPETDVPQQA